MATPNNSVTRQEFEAAMTRIEALLDKQTLILTQLATAEADNRHRDYRISAADGKAERALDSVSKLKLSAAHAAGAASVIVLIAQVALKKLGML